jgi:hypothetical protein
MPNNFGFCATLPDEYCNVLSYGLIESRAEGEDDEDEDGEYFRECMVMSDRTDEGEI